MSEEEPSYEQKAIEVVIEHARNEGHCGVLVTRDAAGNFLYAMATTEVPYGVVREEIKE